jgi:hypothetical protein
MGNLFGDVRYAFRTLARQPGFASVTILTAKSLAQTSGWQRLVISRR